MTDLDRIQACASNHLDARATGKKRLAGVIGDSPSRYSKSPALWNSAFEALGIDAVYVPLDVDASRLSDLLDAVRQSPNVLGINVTVPHKIAVMKHLDGLDESAKRTGAVNTIARSPSGELTGANTDGVGFIESLVEPQTKDDSPLLQSLDGIEALVLGAGGSARAVAFALAERLGRGKLVIANRTYERARSLADDIGKYYGNADAVAEDDIVTAAPQAQLIVNCTIKGQGKMSGDAGAVSLEAHSALAPSARGVEENNRLSEKIARSVPPRTVFYDLVYYPAETTFSRHARESGHRTANGRGMIVAQAVEAFLNHICRRELEAAGLRTQETRCQLRAIMTAAW